jgi:hypothetical protein
VLEIVVGPHLLPQNETDVFRVIYDRVRGLCVPRSPSKALASRVAIPAV